MTIQLNISIINIYIFHYEQPNGNSVVHGNAELPFSHSHSNANKTESETYRMHVVETFPIVREEGVLSSRRLTYIMNKFGKVTLHQAGALGCLTNSIYCKKVTPHQLTMHHIGPCIK